MSKDGWRSGIVDWHMRLHGATKKDQVLLQHNSCHLEREVRNVLMKLERIISNERLLQIDLSSSLGCIPARLVSNGRFLQVQLRTSSSMTRTVLSTKFGTY